MRSLGILTDETLRETVSHGSERFPFQYYFEDIYAFDFHRIDWHWHHELELVYVQEGTAIALIGAERIELPAGYGLIINSATLHRLEAQSRAIIPNIVFAPVLLGTHGSLIFEKYIQPVVDFSATHQVFSPDVPWQSEALRQMRELMELLGAENASELLLVSRLLVFWQLLFDHLVLDTRAAQTPDLQQARLRLMMQFIHDHYADELTLNDIAASASIGDSSALHIFHAGIQQSPIAYLIQYRLSQAALRLVRTQETVASIAEKVGFASAGYFCRKFRQSYHMTPNDYRKKSTVSAT